MISGMASQITSLMIVYSTVYSDADQRKHQSSTWLAFVRGIHRWPLNSTHKGPVRWQMFPFDDVMMIMHNAMILMMYASIRFILFNLSPTQDDVIKWKHFPRYWPFVRGIHRSRWIPRTKPVTQSLGVFFDLNKRLSKQSWSLVIWDAISPIMTSL